MAAFHTQYCLFPCHFWKIIHHQFWEEEYLVLPFPFFTSRAKRLCSSFMVVSQDLSWVIVHLYYVKQCTLCFLQTNYLLEYHGNLEEHCWYDNVSQAEVKVAIIQFSAGGSTITSCRYSVWGCGGWLDGRVIVFIMGKFLIQAPPRFSTVTLDKLLNSWILALLICKERNTITYPEWRHVQHIGWLTICGTLN